MGSTVMFCVGATKAGTSWLHRTLSDHSDCHLRAIKELHYFDALDHGEVDRQIADVEARRGRYLKQLAQADVPAVAARKARQIGDCDDWLSVLRRGSEDRAAYMAYLTEGARGRLVGDMTPAYSLLSETRLRDMTAIAGDVRFVYLVRDPVERLWSHVRMIAGRRAAPGEDISDRALHILRRVFQGKEGEITLRSDYRAALGRLARAVDPRRLLVVVYEELFSAEGLGRVFAFLGIGEGSADFRRRIHASPKAALSAEGRAEARGWLADQYDFVADWLGRRPAGWHYELQRA